MPLEVRSLKLALVIVGVVVLLAGIVGTILVSQAQANLQGRMMNECLSNPLSLTCFSLASSVATYGLYWWLTILLAGVGVIIIIVGLVLAAVSSSPPTAPYPAQPAPYPVQPVPPVAGTQVQPCVRCGHPVRWVPQYNRWYCDAEQMYV